MYTNGLERASADGDSVRVESLAARLRGHVEWLAGQTPPRSFRHPDTLARTADYIDCILRRFNNRVERQIFMIAGMDYHNVFCSFGPANGRRIVVGAHYDVCEDQPGADDNASGVAGLLELAHLLNDNEQELPVRVDLAAYALEEPPFFMTPDMGSAHHTRLLMEQNADVKAMVCLEMIGYYNDAPGSQGFPTPLLKPFYPDRGNFILVVSNFRNRALGSSLTASLKSNGVLEARHLSAPAGWAGMDFSDHYNFWEEGLPAVMITDTAFYRNPFYHEAGDKPDTLDYDKMASLILSLGRWLQSGGT